MNHGSDGTAVTAVPNSGYHFVNWSDASTVNPRTDVNVQGNISVTANFELIAFTKLQVLVPGETAAPGTPSGKTGTPLAQTAGVAFNITVNAVDDNWNLINTITDMVGITSSDVNATLPPNAALVTGTGTFSVTLKTAGSRTVTASDLSDPGKTPDTSSPITLNAGAFTKMQLLVPGETAAPGTATGKTGTPSATTAGVAFNVTVNAVDNFWNLVSSTNTVRITSSDPNATLPADAALVGGTKNMSVTLKTAPSATLTATNVTDGSKASDTSPSIVVNPGAINRLVVTLPGQTFNAGSGNSGTVTSQIAGTVFNITRLTTTDQFFNIVTSYTGGKTISYSGPGGTPLYTTAVTFASGQSTTTLATTLRKAETTTITASDGTTTGPASSSLIVNPGAFTKMQLLVPGETAASGTTTGKTGIPSAQTAGVGFNVTVNAVDANWNLVTSTNTVGITSSDGNAILPSNSSLVGGTQVFAVTLRTAGSRTITATNLTDGSKAPNTSPGITVNAAVATKIRVETAADGSGIVVPSQSITSASTMAVFAITRDQFDNFVANPNSAWSLINKTGGVVDGDLVPVGGGARANFNAADLGTAQIQAASGGLTMTTSGTITVTAGTRTWAGAGGSQGMNWSRGANWVEGSVPTSGTNVVIPNTGISVWPVLDVAGSAMSLTLGGSSASLGFGSNSLTVGGNVSNNGSITSSGGTLNMTGSSNATLSGSGSFRNLIVNKSGGAIVSLSSNVTVPDSLIITAGTLALGSDTLKVSGKVAHNGIMTATNGALQLTGTTATTLTGSGTYSNFTVSKTGAGNVTLGAPITSSGSLGVMSGTLTLGSNNLSIAGNLVQNGTITTSSGLLRLTGTSGATVSGSQSLPNLTIIKTSTLDAPSNQSSLDAVDHETEPASKEVTDSDESIPVVSLGSSITINDALTLTSGELSLGAFNATVVGNVTNAGTISGTTGALRLTGAVSTSISGPGEFQNVTVNKTGADSVRLVSNITVNGTLSVIGGRLSTGLANTIFLGSSATLAEVANRPVVGNIQTTRTVAQNVNNTFGNIGVEILAEGAVPGVTTVRRVTGAAQSGAGNVSIRRYFDIVPTVNTGLDATLTFRYDDTELNGLNEPTLALFRSTNSGGVWVNEGGVLDINANTITAFGLSSMSWWTAADGDNPLPITLASFAASLVNGSHVFLEWVTISEVNNYGFYIQRRRDTTDAFVDLPNSFIAGHGTTIEPHYYSFVDSSISEVGTYYYRLRQVDFNNTNSFTNAVSVSIAVLSVPEQIPHEFRVMQNYPNPFNPSTTIVFSVEKPGHATVSIFNIVGQEVARVFEAMAEPGRYYRLTVDGSRLASGVYFYRVISGTNSEIRKMALIK